MKNWNADEWHLFLCQHCDNRATSPNGLNKVALAIVGEIDDVTAAKRRALKLADERAKEANEMRHQLAAVVTDRDALRKSWDEECEDNKLIEVQLESARKAISAGQNYIDRLTTAWRSDRPVIDLADARVAWFNAMVDASSLFDGQGK